MGNVTTDIALLFEYLLPGFVAAWIFYSLTSYPKPSQFERVVQALIYNLFIQALVNILRLIVLFVGKSARFSVWSDSATLISSILCAVFVGIVFSYFANNDKLHEFLRKYKITKQTSYPSEWFSAFAKDVTYVVLHLKDERRIYGWPIEWPSDPSKGHFMLKQPSWLVEGDETELENVDSILIDTKDVMWVEFMKKTWETNNVKENLESTPSNSSTK